MMQDNDAVNHPLHYTVGGVECFDAMIATQGTEAVKSFCACAAFKYLWRHNYKGSNRQDIEKAVNYLNKWLELDQNEAE